MELDSTLILTLKTYASFFLAWGLPCVYLCFMFVGKDPVRGQLSWDVELAEIKRRRRNKSASVQGEYNFKPKSSPEKSNVTADGFIPLNQSLLKSVVNQQKKKLPIDK